MSFETPGGDTRPWTFVLGENGAGKSTVLRSIALVLAGSEAPPEILGDLDWWIAEAWNAGAGELEVPSLGKWRETSGLPWIGFWFRELLRWGTLDPFIAFTLAQGIVGTRHDGAARRADYEAWLAKRKSIITDEDLIDPQLFLEWHKSVPKRERAAPAAGVVSASLLEWSFSKIAEPRQHLLRIDQLTLAVADHETLPEHVGVVQLADRQSRLTFDSLARFFVGHCPCQIFSSRWSYTAPLQHQHSHPGRSPKFSAGAHA